MNTGNREKRKNRIDNSFNKPPYSILLLCLPQTKNPANVGLDVDERNKYNHFVNVNCIQTSCSTFHVIDHVIEFSDRFTV